MTQEKVDPKTKELFNNMIDLSNEYLDKIIEELSKERKEIALINLVGALLGGPTYVVSRLIVLLSKTTETSADKIMDLFIKKLKLATEVIEEKTREH
jgi:hypothetical protein